MSYASATGAQRLEVSSAALLLSAVTAPARHGLNGPGVAGHDDAEAAAARAAAALAAIGVTAALPSNQAVVTSGAEYEATGGTVTLTVVAGVVTAEFTPD